MCSAFHLLVDIPVGPLFGYYGHLCTGSFADICFNIRLTIFLISKSLFLLLANKYDNSRREREISRKGVLGQGKDFIFKIQKF